MAGDRATILGEPVRLDPPPGCRWRRLATSLAVVLAALYLPFLWEPFVQFQEPSSGLRQIGLTVISPGLLATAMLFTPLVNDNPALAYAISSGFALVVIAVLTLIGAQSLPARITVVILALIVSLPTSFLFFVASQGGGD